ncbi:RNA ligase family protein [Nocardia brasiliensis]|uniref:RNA ligase family protein n=1 Tax=Nocardia brasiliensis TaxID=37326 RepID=UPI0024558A76|nr:RNA ligase family protein [Nocardia brasiliensis]
MAYLLNFDRPKNENYAAVITTVKAVLDLPKRDRIVGLPLFGYQAIASKGWAVGDLGVFIPAEAQLSHEYASNNNMYRHENLNREPSEKGYLEDNRRVKAIKLGGHTSNALFMPLSSLDFTGVDISKLQPGDTFDTINGIEIVRKYEIRPTKEPNNQAPKIRKSRVDAKLFPEHVSTANYWRMIHNIDPSDYLYVTQKLHGTSIRVGNVPVSRKLTWRDRFGKFIGAQIQHTEYDMVYGSRRVIKDANANQNHFYASDIWTLEGKKLDGLIPSGYLVFGELIGWTPDGRPIQTGYTYRVPERQARLYVYRVATVNTQGIVTDLSWPQVEEFCRNVGLTTVPLLWSGYADKFNADEWMNVRYADDWVTAYIDRPVPLEPGATVDEGVVVRVDGLTPTLLKAKASQFLEHETKELDTGSADLESVG